ncbi:MAG TPA: hypothetical protein VN371_05295 [Chlorobaculum sp.]|nr:hypothetical protein [Chlorobaculum sp.]
MDRLRRVGMTVTGIVGWFFAFGGGPAHADETRDAFAGGVSLKTAYESLSLPGKEKMGFGEIGISKDIGESFNVGVDIWSAVRGNRGGFITIGVDGGFHTPIVDGLELEGGAFVGAGGGRGGYTLSGGGLMLRAYGGLAFDMGSFGRLGAGVSYVDFPNSGSIHSTQPVVFYTVPLSFSGRTTKGSTGSSTVRQHENSVALVASELRVKSSARTIKGAKQGDLKLVGITWRNYLDDNWYIKLEAEGAAGGSSSGYMQVLAGGGVRVPIAGGLYANADASVGGGGGGAVDTRGGLLLGASAGFQYFLTRDLYTGVSAGYLAAARGSFRAFNPTLQLGYRFGGKDDANTNSVDEPIPLRVRVTSQTYLNGSTGWRSSYTDRNVDNLGVQFDYFVLPSLYLSGQALGAYNGQAGAYMVGLVGPGVRPNITEHFFFDAEALVGAAGGGGLAVGSGLVWQGNAGLGYQISKEVSLMVNYGRIGAFNGDLRAGVIGISLGYGNR